jgi:PTH2 family peptidyl-tRNA hydrolase
MKLKQVIVVRKDLNMRKGKIASQVAHGVLNVTIKTAIKNGEKFSLNQMGKLETKGETYLGKWLDTSYRKIVLYVESEDELLRLQLKLDSKNIISTLVQDNGLTEFKGVKTYTCIAIEPLPDEIIDEITGGLRLL